MNQRLLSSASRAALAAAGLVFATAPALSQTVGKTAAVNPASTASGKVLTLGKEVVHKERIRTSESGSVQLLFLDRSTMNIGPNADVTIDEYVFDPRTNTGKMTASIGKGLMRFVGGQISHDGKATIKTPSTTIGIRGAVGYFSYDPDTKLTTASNDCKDCTLTLTAPNGQKVTIPPGFTATLGSDGKISLGPTTQEQADKNLKQTGSKNGQTGGANEQTSQDAANKDSQFTQNGSQQQPPPTNVTPPTLPPTEPPSATGAAPFAMSLNTTWSVGSFAAPGGSALSANSASGGESSYFSDSIHFSPVLGYRNASAAGSNAPAPATTLQYSFGIVNLNESGTSQLSFGHVATGAFRSDENGNLQQTGAIQGSAKLTTPWVEALATTEGTFASVAEGVQKDEQALPTVSNITGNVNANVAYKVFGSSGSFQLPLTFTGEQTRIPLIPQGEPPTPAVPVALGENRPAVTLQGYVSGMVREENSEGYPSVKNFVVGNKNNLPTDFTLKLDPSTSSVSAAMTLVDKTSGSPEEQGAVLKFGSDASTDPNRSAYIDHDNFAALDQRTAPTSEAPNGTPTTVVDSATVGKSDGFLINATAEIKQKVATALNITPCTCEYTRWGFWSVGLKNSEGTIENNAHMNTWVAGRLVKASDVPQTGEASYSGHIVANVRNNGKEYMAGGSFNNTVNFGTRNISTTASLDGASFAGNLTVNEADRRNFAGSMAGTTTGSYPQNRTMEMIGSFFKGPTNKVGEMGGSVQVTGTNYMAGGIFAGTMNSPVGAAAKLGKIK